METFEEIIKGKLAEHKVQPPLDGFNAVQKKMGTNAAKTVLTKVAAIAAGVAAVATSAYLVVSNNDKVTGNEKVVINNEDSPVIMDNTKEVTPISQEEFDKDVAKQIAIDNEKAINSNDPSGATVIEEAATLEQEQESTKVSPQKEKSPKTNLTPTTLDDKFSKRPNAISQNIDKQVKENSSSTPKEPISIEEPTTLVEPENVLHSSIKKLPNIITPSVRDGINDNYTIESENMKIFKFVIMDNSNNVVFETDDPNFEWDGTINGRVIPGSYIGLLSAIGEDGKDHLKQVLITVQ